MSFASSLTSNLRRVPGDLEPTPGYGRQTMVANVERWFVGAAATASERTALLVLDVDIDDALPTFDDAATLTPAERPLLSAELEAALESAYDAAAEAEDGARRHLLGRSVARAISAHVRPGDTVARIDAGRFAVLRGTLGDGESARSEADALAHGVEDALVGRPEGFGVRVTAGATTLVADAPRAGRTTLGAVTTAMLEGKLLTDDRVVVVVASGG